MNTNYCGGDCRVRAKRRKIAFLSSVAVFWLSCPATAQQVATAAAEDSESAEIIVTAQRRSQRIQDVPVAVTAFSGESLAASGVGKILDLQQVDSSLVISQQSGAVIPFLRGVGNPASATPGNESSVPIYIDDVYYARLSPAYLRLANIERAEVLKGPQGTLFGRNATGGLIQIFTRNPDRDKPVGDLTVGYGNYQTLTGKLYLSAPLSQSVAIDLSASGQDMGRGFGRNILVGGDTYYDKFYNFRSKLVADVGERTRVVLSGFYVYQNASIGESQGGGYPQFLRGLPPTFTTVYAPAPGFFDLNTDTPNFHRHRGYGGSLKIDRELGFADVTSISAFKRSNEIWQSEGDSTNYPWSSYILHPRDRQITQELQLKSKPAQKISWLVGLFYIKSKQEVDPVTITGESITSGGLDSFNLIGRQTINSYAVFGQATMPLFDRKTNFTVGLRYTWDKVDGFGRQFIVLPGGTEAPAAPDYAQKKNFQNSPIDLRSTIDFPRM